MASINKKKKFGTSQISCVEKSENTYKNSLSKNIFFLFVRGSTNEIFQKLKLSWWFVAFRWWEYGGHKYHVKGLLRSVAEFNSSDFLPRAAIFWMHKQNVPRQNVLRQNVPWTKRPNGQSNLHTGTEFIYLAVEIWYSLLSGLWRRWRNEMAPLPARKSPGKNKNFWKLFLVFPNCFAGSGLKMKWAISRIRFQLNVGN